mmetsp:Transcript_3198/g.4965  ORF Transcript_3198/g.4965 Transcript_3198/m.4965 type:complete len:310 (+) Transcript_3198:119-1048(+)|eukprot:CAMPEP_0171461478 /NCGR_PEP_ID=MMETSP0945-20130129/5909_1 /TAXON_ID=109269 /ORGANISM="Vaucheria litorea, Strain CCMP2940" /LENGTH=309 /DNA_ID=CAMNT_0011987831 /DNA_START=119 /DNA_END=1048 /DNA_ORIENTATION=+
MKFGKNLEKVMSISDPEWAPFWLNYKHLKKILKKIRNEKKPTIQFENGLKNDPHTLAKSEGEVEFFKALRQELSKCNDFFLSIEAQFIARNKRIQEGWDHLKTLPNYSTLYYQQSRLMAACVRLYKDLLMLENFAILNYTAFSKILKKHDKLTGHSTRDRYMSNVINVMANFAHYPRLLKLLEVVEALFKELQRFNTLPDLHEKQLFIDTLKSINDQAAMMAQNDYNSQEIIDQQPFPSNGQLIPILLKKRPVSCSLEDKVFQVAESRMNFLADVSESVSESSFTSTDGSTNSPSNFKEAFGPTKRMCR